MFGEAQKHGNRTRSLPNVRQMLSTLAISAVTKMNRTSASKAAVMISVPLRIKPKAISAFSALGDDEN